MIIKRVSDEQEIIGIKKLQNKNLKKNLPAEEILKEGFVTAEYSIPLLAQMNSIEPSIIAKDGETVAGYALVVTKELYGQHDLLDDLFNQINSYVYNGTVLQEVNYAIVGQLCVAKTHRGSGIVQKMYHFYQEQLSGKYPYLITDVDDKNPRSIKAHIKTGFEIIGTSNYGGGNWHIVLWDWNKEDSNSN
jgi:ribosomal protein S18 acetylase RimI-like enzyme